MSKRSLWKSYLAGYWLGDLTLKAYCQQQKLPYETCLCWFKIFGNVPNFVTEWRNLSEALNALN